MSTQALLAATVAVAVVTEAHGHAGRRLQVEVVDGKLQAQGIDTGQASGAPAVRPYVNAIHEHWQNVPGSGFAFARLPGFDVPPTQALAGHDLELDWISTQRWVSPPPMPTETTVPRLEPLAPGTRISISAVSDANSDSRGALVLVESVQAVGAADVDLYYQINGLPTDEIYVLTFILSAHPESGVAGAIAASDPISILLAPDGTTPAERLHHSAQFLEAYVATVPEPGVPAAAALFLLAGGVRSRGP
ncbi:MAG: hypothetical protein AAGB00_02425 [Planctomycetota bacterium]